VWPDAELQHHQGKSFCRIGPAELAGGVGHLLPYLRISEQAIQRLLQPSRGSVGADKCNGSTCPGKVPSIVRLLVASGGTEGE
jgi:hypothetical protein